MPVHRLPQGRSGSFRLALLWMSYPRLMPYCSAITIMIIWIWPVWNGCTTLLRCRFILVWVMPGICQNIIPCMKWTGGKMPFLKRSGLSIRRLNMPQGAVCAIRTVHFGEAFLYYMARNIVSLPEIVATPHILKKFVNVWVHRELPYSRLERMNRVN